jgi:hypothetical protein
MDAEDGNLPLNCPHCGRRMHFVNANSPRAPVLKSDPPAPPTFFVFECPQHGLFHYGPKTPLTAGPPPAGWDQSRRRDRDSE